MGLILYTARFDSVPVIGCSPPSWAVWLACLEKGLSVEHHRLDFAAGEHKSPAFLAINPKGTLPALFDQGRLVSETRAMLECIHRQPGPSLLGETPQQRAQGIVQLNRANTVKDAGMAWLRALMAQRSNAEERTDEPTHDLSTLRAAYGEQLEALCGAFCEGPFLAPADLAQARPGLADLLCYAYVATTARLQIELSPWPRLASWLDAMAARESVQATQP